jgi:hypothetical protein
MPLSLSPVKLVQNPALGSILLWKFGRGYQEESISRQANLELLFLVLPLTLHRPTLLEVSSTLPSSGLGKFVSKLAENRENLVAVHGRALSLRFLTLQSLGTGLATKLLSVSYETGNVRANEAKPPRPPERLKAATAGAEKLGKWFARTPSDQIFSLLQVHP